MEELKHESFTQARRHVRKGLLLYALGFVVFLLTLSGAILMKKYTTSLYATLDRLQEFNVQYIRVRAAIDDIDRSLVRMEALMSGGISGRSVEESLFVALDDLKTKAVGADMKVANMEDKGAEVLLPVTIRGPLKDYTSLTKYVGYLQSLSFPFFAIAELKLQRNEDGTTATTFYEIKGSLKCPKANPAQQSERSTVKTEGKS